MALSFTERVALVESSNNPNARAKTSSATGLYQFIDATWLENVGKHAPDLMEGRSDEEILALRTDPEISTRIFRKFTEDNARHLTKRGIEPTPSNLYLAHFLGKNGATRLLRNDTGRRLDEAGFSWVLKANPNVKEAGGTIGDLVGWAEGKMADTSPFGAASADGIIEGASAEFPPPKTPLK